MQRHRILLVTAAIACAPLGCQTVSDVFNEPPREQQTERAEEEDESEARRAERPSDRDDARRGRTREAQEAREEARERQRQEAARERRAERRETREEAREDAREEIREKARERTQERSERMSERRRTTLARDYITPASCPVQIEGARVSMIDIVDGIALDFRAASDEDTAAVQERVRRLMDTQREVRSAADVDDPDLEALPPARVEYDMQRQGARIEFKVDNQADLRDLRAQLRERISVLREEGECPRHFMTMLSTGRDREG